MPILFVFFSASNEETTFPTEAAIAGDGQEEEERIWIITSPILIVIMFIIIIALISRKKKVRLTISPLDIPSSLDMSGENSLDNTYLEPIPPPPHRMLPPLPTGTSTPTSFASVRDLTPESPTVISLEVEVHSPVDTSLSIITPTPIEHDESLDVTLTPSIATTLNSELSTPAPSSPNHDDELAINRDLILESVDDDDATIETPTPTPERADDATIETPTPTPECADDGPPRLTPEGIPARTRSGRVYSR